jgi:kumamolisin
VNGQRADLPGSTPKLRPGDKWLGPADPQQELTVSILLRRPASAADIGEAILSGTYHPQSREAAEAALAADPNDLAAVETFVRDSGMEILSVDAPSRTIRIRGTVERFDRAFGIEIGWVQDVRGDHYLTYRGSITLPESIAPAVTAVLGLDQRPVARHHRT